MTDTHQGLSRTAHGALPAALLALTLNAAGCGSPEREPASRADPEVMAAREQAMARKGMDPVPAPDAEAVVGEVPARVMTDVRDHLAGRTGGRPDAFEVIRAEAHEWPSGAMGCPQPDLTYTPRPVSGYWIVLRHDDRDYDYRLSDTGTLVLCEGMMLEDPPAL